MNGTSNAAHAFLWSFCERVGAQALRVIIGLALARLLAPQDFGLISALAVPMAAAQLLMNCGLGTALIRQKVVSSTDESSMFFFNVVAGVVLSAALFLAAPWIGSFYRLSPLVPICRALSLNIILASLGNVQGSLLARRLDFLAFCKVSVASTCSSGIVGLILASKGYGVWSLVGQQLTANLADAVLLSAASRWRPTLHFSFGSIYKLLNFGAPLAFVSLIDSFARNVSFAVIGKRFGPTDVGLYSKALQMEELPVLTLYYALLRPSLPFFASAQDSPVQLAHRFRRVTQYVAFITFPTLAILGVCARPIVRLLLTDKWSGSIPLLEWLCVAGVLVPMSRLNLTLCLAKGQSTTFFWLELLRATFACICVIALGLISLKAIVIGQAAFGCVIWVINGTKAGRLISYPFSRQLRDVMPYALLSMVVAGSVAAVGVEVGDNNAGLAVQLMSGVLLYVGLCSAFRVPALSEMKYHLARILHSKAAPDFI